MRMTKSDRNDNNGHNKIDWGRLQVQKDLRVRRKNYSEKIKVRNAQVKIIETVVQPRERGSGDDREERKKNDPFVLLLEPKVEEIC